MDAQNEYIKQAEDERAIRRAKNDYLDFSSSSTSSNEEEEDDEENNPEVKEGATSNDKTAGNKSDVTTNATNVAASKTVNDDGENSISK